MKWAEFLGIAAVLDAWRNREMEILRLANAEFRKLGLEEKRTMILAIREDDKIVNARMHLQIVTDPTKTRIGA